MIAGIAAAVFIIALIALVVMLRKKIFVLIGDLVIAFVVYLAVIFIVSWFGVHLPINLSEWGLPICMLCIIAWHIISNLNSGRKTTPWGAL